MKEINPNESLLQSSFSEKRFNQIKEFIINIWKSKAQYKVLMARRAFNLNHAFMMACYAQMDEECITDNIMSNTALLLYAEEVAEYYGRVERFPSILIADDLTFHGRGIIKLLDNFETLIIDFLRRKDREVDKTVIHEKMISAVSIYVFAQNKEGLLIDPRYMMKSEQYLPMNELRRLSQQISNALQICGTANTSYVLSSAIPTYLLRELDDSSYLPESSNLLRYRGYSQLYYYKCNNILLKTIRTSIPANSRRLDRMFTSLVTFGDISFSEFNEVCDNIAERINMIIPYSRIAEILRYKNKALARSRAQMLSFLLSIECFAEFYREKILADNAILYNILLKSDYRKIVTNFTRASVLRYEIIELFKNICFTNVFEYTISEQLRGYVQNIKGVEESILSDSFEIGKMEDVRENIRLCEMAEDIFYEVGINAECAAVSYIEEHREFNPAFPGSDVIRFDQYLAIMNREINNVKNNSVKSVGCVFALMDSGLLSMNIEKNQENIQCVLKSGELAMYVLPRRFSVFIHALSIVERYAQKRGLDLRLVVSRFIDYLQDHCYERNKSKSMEDSKLLRQLKESKGILLYMYESGQLFQDWDTELLTKGDRVDIIEEQYGRYKPSRYEAELWGEDARKRHYAYYAMSFIHSDDW